MASIWIEVGRYRNRWTIDCFYREFRYLNSPESDNIMKQEVRLDKFLQIVENLEDSRNTLIVGDMDINLNYNDENVLGESMDFEDRLLERLPPIEFSHPLDSHKL